jgi:hypothetical protein
MAKKRKGEFSWKEDRLLIQIAPGSAPSEEAAVIFRRSVEAARWRRPPACKAEGEAQVVMAYSSTPWTPEDDTLLRKLCSKTRLHSKLLSNWDDRYLPSEPALTGWAYHSVSF